MKAPDDQFFLPPNRMSFQPEIDEMDAGSSGSSLDSAAGIDAADSSVDLPGQRLYTVLIVDDSKADRLLYRRYIQALDRVDCEVIEANCGKTGLTLYQQHSPDLILLDYRLPDLDGLTFLSVLAESAPPSPPTIMLTGEGNEKVAVAAMKLGARDYLIKGDLTSQSFSQALRRVLSQQALQQLVSRQQRQQRLMAATSLRISQSTDLESVLKTTVDGIRELLDCDRTVVYKIESDREGVIVAESVLPGWTSGIGIAIKDTCFQTGEGLARYLSGYKTVISDIYSSKLTRCHIQMLERFQVKANLVVPIVLASTETQQKKVWGLLLAHQCRATREWLDDELALLDALAVQFAIAIQQSELVSTLKSRADELSTINCKLLSTMQQLKERNQELDNFAYIASHDLRAPLRAISNLTSWLEEDISDKIPEENKQQIQLIHQRTQRLDGFIIGLLNYSRAGRQSLEKESVDTRVLVSDVVEALSPPETFAIVLPENMPILSTYKLLLYQVFSNLISNAIKYHHKPEGTIQIQIKDLGDRLLFSVTDDGPGIDPAYHQQVFGLFQTLNSKDRVESTGIGLSIVKKIVERQRGTLSIDSAVGKGSTFSFTWPSRQLL